MELNENIIKNIANEITRNCQSKNVVVEYEFVVHLIGLLVLNPIHSKLLAKFSNRNNLELFVNNCVSLLISGSSSLNTLKIQYLFQTNYDKLNVLLENHKKMADASLKPLVAEITEIHPKLEDEVEVMKLFRKISIYIILSSGLGNPGVILTLKEGMAALDSVFTFEDIVAFLELSKDEKAFQMRQLTHIVSGVRLFNKDCRKGGEGIQELPQDLDDAIKACTALLSNKLVTIMQWINSMTTAIDDVIVTDEHNDTMFIQPRAGVTSNDYKHIFSYLAFYRQYEVYVRQLLSDVEVITKEAKFHMNQLKLTLKEVHGVVKYKSAVPVVAVFPLFVQLWRVWRELQNLMYLISTVNNVFAMLTTQLECVRIPNHILKTMLVGKTIITDQERATKAVPMIDKMSILSLKNVVPFIESPKNKSIQYLGFCAICLCKGALVPCNLKLGVMKYDSVLYGFCNPEMASFFNHHPERYINRALGYIRNNPHLIILLNVKSDLKRVQNVEDLIMKAETKITYYEKDVQTELHPVPENIVRDYVWNLWEYKRRACQWATIVNCQTHSTQTNHSHLRSEIQCQTTEPRDKCLQTRKDNTTECVPLRCFPWGIRGRYGPGHVWNITESYKTDSKEVKPLLICEELLKKKNVKGRLK